MDVKKARIILLTAGIAFTVYIADIYLKTLKPPDHIHSRDDVPQGAQQSATPQEIAAWEADFADDPDNIKLIFQLGHTYLEIKDYHKAEKIFRHGWERFPDNAEMLVDLAVALRGLDRLEESLKHLLQATQQFPAYGDGWLQLAVLYRFNLKDNQKALHYFEKYLELEDEGETAMRVRQEIKRIKTEMQQL